MRTLKIAIWYNLPSGGAKRALSYHAHGLAGRGHHLESWRPPTGREWFASLSDAVQEHEVALESEPENLGYMATVAKYPGRTKRMIAAMKRHSELCARQIHEGGFDLLFSNTCLQFAAPFIGRYVDLPSALYLQEPHRPFYEPMPRLPLVALDEQTLRRSTPKAIKARIRDRMDLNGARIQAREERNNAAAHDRLLVNSLFSREAMLRAYGLNSEVCYLGVDTNLFRDLGLERGNFVVGLGTIGPTKNVRLAIEGVGSIPRHVRPKLLWVGNMTDDVYLEEQRELALKLDVDFETQVMISDEALVEVLNQAKAMIYAPRLEPFGLAPLEANACGCPVVAVAEGGVRESIIDGVNGCIVEHNPEAVGCAVLKLLENEDLARGIGEAGKSLVSERWSLEASIDRLENALLRTAG